MNPWFHKPWFPRFDWLEKLVVCAIVGMLAAQLFLVLRMPFNWDEFFFLSMVHDLHRGELNRWFMTFHAQLFQWVLYFDGELAQMQAGRIAAYVLLPLKLFILYHVSYLLTRNNKASLLAVLFFLVNFENLRHGNSFRSDSFITALCLGSFYLILFRKTWLTVLAGLLFATAVCITPKSLVFLPLLVVAELDFTTLRKSAFRTRAVFALSAIISYGILRFLHEMSVNTSEQFAIPTLDSVETFVTFFNGSFRLKWKFLRHWIAYNPWLVPLFLAGCYHYWRSRRSRLLLLALLAPLLVTPFYRNTYSYYFPLVGLCLVPVFAFAFAWLMETTLCKRYKASALCILVVAALAVGALHVRLNDQTRAHQAFILQVIHDTFPEPVPYLDKAGFVSSFPRYGPILSTAYLESRLGKTAMLTRTPRPVFLFDNGGFMRQLKHPSDRLLLRDYRRYWGKIYVLKDTPLPPPPKKRYPGNNVFQSFY